MISIDCETTGLDLYHGARPFLVTSCDEAGNVLYWEWEVDPLTRTPRMPEEDAAEINELVQSADVIVGQNLKFDVAMFREAGIVTDWPWERTEDTLMSGHILASNHKHTLDAMVLDYLDTDIEPLEKLLEQHTQASRQYCRAHLPRWRLAKKGNEEMPSAKDKTWKYDSWVPRALIDHIFQESMCYVTWRNEYGFDPDAFDKLKWLPGYESRPPEYGGDDPRWTVGSNYANGDSLSTMRLWQKHKELLLQQDLWEMYRARMRTAQIASRMEKNGVTKSEVRSDALCQEFSDESARCECICVNLAEERGYKLTLPKSGTNRSLTTFLVEGLELPVRRFTAKEGRPSINKDSLQEWLDEAESGTETHLLLTCLSEKRRYDTARSYLESYNRFAIPVKHLSNGHASEWSLLHPSMNPTGTDTLRWSSANPNSTNFSKKEIECSWCGGEGCDMCNGTGTVSLNLRRILGPAPGREWWSMDAKNIERRIPIYESGEEEGIHLIERPDDPPYYGSEHGLVAHLLYPKEFEACGDAKAFKKKYAATLYQYVKNGNFAVQYGCQQRKADSTYRVEGAYHRIKQRFARLESLNQYWIRFANKYGYVETIPDRAVNPRRGYPILCSRSDSGFILPTVPLNYHVQSTACWMVSVRWLTLCQDKLDEWHRTDPTFDGFICLDVHDELVFDFPKRGNPVADNKIRNGQGPLFRTSTTSNLWRVRVLQEQLRIVGRDHGVPLEAGAEFHAENYAEGITLG